MKRLSVFFTVINLMAIAATVKGQIAYPIDSAAQNPMALPREISGNREIILTYETGTTHRIKRRFIEVNQLDPNTLDQIIDLNTSFAADDNEVSNAAGNRHLASCTGDFNGDHRDDILTANETTNYKIALRSFTADPNAFPELISDQNTGTLESPTLVGTLSSSSNRTGIIRLASGNFDDQPDAEAVLLYRDNATDLLTIVIYDFTASLELIPIGQISDENSPNQSNDWESFDLEIVDLDYDGTSEIVIASSQLNGGYRKPFVKVYDVTTVGDEATILPKEKTYVPSTYSNSEHLSIAIATGDFNRDYIQEIALVYTAQVVYDPIEEDISMADTFIRIFRVGDDLTTPSNTPDWLEKTILTPDIHSSLLSEDFLFIVELDAGDVDGDGDDEVFLGTNAGIKMITINEDLTFAEAADVDGSYEVPEEVYITQAMTVGDMNNDGRAEVTRVINYYTDIPVTQIFSVEVFTFQITSGGIATEVLASDNYYAPYEDNDYRNTTVSIGDFDGDNLRFGPPVHSVVQDIMEPLIILNAPPTHSDLLGENNWSDINGIWDGNWGSFQSTFSETSELTFSVQNTVSSTWAIGATISAEYEGLVANASASFTASYGENYSNATGTSNSIVETSQQTVNFDDAIYASIITYDVFEYPIYIGDSLINHIISFHPRTNDISYAWFDSKSSTMQHFIPTHEPGSLLSYRPLEGSTYDTPGNTFYEGQVINLSTSSSQNWGIEFTTLSFEEVENARDHSLAYSASIGAFGISASIEGSYDWSEIATQTTEVGSGIQIATNLGTIPLASSNALYNTKPFIFWDQNNTMVLDYEVSATGDFYTQNYNIQDPAWNMPWRLDPERGDLSVTPTLTRQTKSLWFDDHSPEPGDTITVFARVFNYSLVATESPVDVSFFLGNPYNGGQAIAGINGETSVSTDGIIAPQQFKEVSMHLILPADVDYDGRLYARIDPDSIMIEVHEENNLTWKSLGPNFNLIEDDYEEEAPIMINEGEINWHLQCYPNPTKNNVDIWAQLDHPQITQVYVYNVFGDIVHEEAAIANGLGQCHVQLQLNSLPAGMYVVQLTNAHAQQSLRLIKE